MTKRKSSGVIALNLIVGLLLIAVGIFLLIKTRTVSDPLLFIIISAADILFGLFLAIGALLSNKGSEAGFDPDRREVDGMIHYGDSDALDAAERNANRRAEAPQEQPEEDYARPEEPCYAAMSPDEIFAEEQRLRKQAQEAEHNAERAVKAARHAVAEARAAENDLDSAKDKAQQLYGYEQQQAFREVSQLAEIAREKAQRANAAVKRANAARRAAEDAAERHSRAMDAAADAMDDDLGDDLFSSDNAGADYSAPQNTAGADSGFDDDF